MEGSFGRVMVAGSSLQLNLQPRLHSTALYPELLSQGANHGEAIEQYTTKRNHTKQGNVRFVDVRFVVIHSMMPVSNQQSQLCSQGGR